MKKRNLLLLCAAMNAACALYSASVPSAEMEKLSAEMVDSAFEEAVACLEKYKDILPEQELRRLAENLEAEYDALMATDASPDRGIKRFANLLVHNGLSCGSLFVGGDEVVDHDLTVNNNLTVGDIVVDGTITSSAGEFGDVSVTGSTTLGTCTSTNTLAGTTNINTNCAAPTNIATGGTGEVNIGNTTGGSSVSGSLKLLNNPAASSGDLILQINPTTGVVTQGAIPGGGIVTLQGDNGETASGSLVTIAGDDTNITTYGNNATILTVSLNPSVSVAGSLTAGTTVTAGTGLTVTSGGANITGTTNINTSGNAATTIGTGGSGSVNIGNTTGNTFVAGSLLVGTNETYEQVVVAGLVPSGNVGIVGTDNGPYSTYVQGRYAYVVNNTSNTLQIFDVSNSASPTEVGDVGTGGGPTSVYVQGRYAYVVNADSETLQIFDVSNPASPTEVGSVGTGNYSVSLSVQGRYVYVVGTNSTLQVFDVSNPALPTSVGSVGTENDPSSLYVQGRYAYVVTLGGALQIFDVSNPASPTSVGSVGTGSGPYSVYVQGSYAYVVVTLEGEGALQIFDVSNPTSPISVGSVGAGYDPLPVYVQGRYAYVLNSEDYTLQIFDVSDPTSPISIGTVGTGALPRSLYVQGRYAYVGNYSDNTLQIFDVGGAYIQQLEAGGIEVGTLQTRENMTVNNDLDVRGGAVFGQGFQSTGPSSVAGVAGSPVITLISGSTALASAPVWINPATSASAGTPIQYDASGQLFGFTSSERYKDNIRSIESESEIIYQLNPVIYDAKAGHGVGSNIPGFIAEDVYRVAPHLAVLNSKNEPENVAYTSLHALAIKEIQKHQDTIELLLKRIEKLEAAQ